MQPIVIIGAGMAAYSVAREFRKLDKTTALTIVAADAGGAYAKPMLSNAIAMGKGAAQLVSQSAQQMAQQLGATILTHTCVTSIDSVAHEIHTAGGPIGYAKLVLALGAQPIRLATAGNAAAEVLSVNHLDDYALLRAMLDAIGGPARVAIMGAGLIGCEFADDLLAGGHAVTLIDPNALPLGALAAPSLAAGLASAWQGRALTLCLGTTVARVDRVADDLDLTLADGRHVAADIVLSAVGLRPATALAVNAGLTTRRGVVVDAFGQTSAMDIYALGDCAEYTTAYGSAVMPYVAPLMAAARAIASTLAGNPAAIDLKQDAVIVKTPSFKLALAPPPPGTAGGWVDEHDGERIIARFIGTDGAVRGFGLSAHTPALRQKLQAEM